MNRRSLLLGLNDFCVNNDTYVSFNVGALVPIGREFKITLNGQNITNDGTLYYSFNGIDWSLWDKSTIENSIIGVGQRRTIYIYIRGLNNTYIRGDSTNGGLIIEAYLNGTQLTGASINSKGCVEALLDYKKYAKGQNITKANETFARLFQKTKIYTSPTLPATNLTSGCYYHMFDECSLLSSAPELPATNLSSYCYAYMFKGCSSLTSAPELPASTIPEQAYKEMFRNCTSLTALPILSARTLGLYCYQSMFEGCTSLEELPRLSATTLVEACYIYMFYGCSNIKLSTTQDSTYQYVYRIPTDGTGTIATSALYQMFTNTGGTFTGTPQINTNYYCTTHTDYPDPFLVSKYVNSGGDFEFRILNQSGKTQQLVVMCSQNILSTNLADNAEFVLNQNTSSYLSGLVDEYISHNLYDSIYCFLKDIDTGVTSKNTILLPARID